MSDEIPEIDASEALSEREQREAVFRSMFGGQSYDAIAEELGVGSSTVGRVVRSYRSITGDGRVALEEWLIEEFDGVEGVDPDAEVDVDSEDAQSGAEPSESEDGPSVADDDGASEADEEVPLDGVDAEEVLRELQEEAEADEGDEDELGDLDSEILELVERGASPSEAVDYVATQIDGRTQTDWAESRGLSGHQSVGRNARRGEEFADG